MIDHREATRLHCLQTLDQARANCAEAGKHLEDARGFLERAEDYHRRADRLATLAFAFAVLSAAIWLAIGAVVAGCVR